MKIIYLVKEKDENKIIESFNSLEEAEKFIKYKLKEARADLRKFYASEGKCHKCPYARWLTEKQLQEIKEAKPKCYNKKKCKQDYFYIGCASCEDKFMCHNYKYVEAPKLPEFYIEELKTELTTEEELLEKIKEVEIWKEAFDYCWDALQGSDIYYHFTNKNAFLYEVKKSIIKRFK